MAGPKSGLPLDVEACQKVFASFYRRMTITDSGCWAWTGARNQLDYGLVRVGKMQKAHRVAWVARNGRDIPAGQTIDHLCRNRSCVNPEHLEPVPHALNLLRSPATIIGRQAVR